MMSTHHISGSLFAAALIGAVLAVASLGCIEDPDTIQTDGTDSNDATAPTDDCDDELQWCDEAFGGYGGCVDTDSDPDHCGECSNTCPAGEEGQPAICVQGQCDVGCDEAAGLKDCGDPEACTDVSSDPDHCGGCGIRCNSGTCVDGYCKPFECEPGSDDDSPFGGGSGTVQDPFTICSQDQLLVLIENNDALAWSHFALSDDINMEDVDVDTPLIIPEFHATFDGFGHAIENLHIEANWENVGFFSWVGPTASISDVQLTNLSVASSATDQPNRTGGLVAYNEGDLSRITVEGTIVGHSRVGAIAGYNNGRIVDSSASDIVRASYQWAGGLVGVNDTLIEGVEFMGTVEAHGEAGGIAGRHRGTIIDSDVVADVSIPPEGVDAGGDRGGGIVGRILEQGQIADCSAEGDVSINGDHAGGIIGQADPDDSITIDNCHATVDVSGNAYVGGFVGRAEHTSIENSSAEGDIDATGNDVGGFAGRLDEGSTVDNSDAVADIESSGNRLAGGFVGILVNNSSISDCNCEGTLEGDGMVNTGGLAGRVGNDSTVEDCTAATSVDITADNDNGVRLGGLVGRLDNNSEVTDSDAEGTVTAENGTQVGGLVGRAASSTTINGGTAAGDVLTGEGGHVGGLVGRLLDDASVTDSAASGDVTGHSNIGGLVGRSYGSIDNSFATGDVDGAHERVGGLAGHNDGDGTITGSFATGNTVGNERVGGLVGHSNGTIEDCYALGDVTGGWRVGGLVGVLGYWGGTVTRSYSAGSVDDTADEVGGLVGNDRSDDRITASYWNTSTSGIEDDDEDATGIPTDDFGDEATFEGWDFDDIWTIPDSDDVEDGDFQRPHLLWELDQ